MKLTRTHQWGLGLLLIACANLFVLAGVAWNRSGEPESILKLSERELGSGSYVFSDDIDRQGDRRTQENSALRLRIRLGGETYYASDYTVQQEKMAELGFSQRLGEDDRETESRGGLIVLELDGPAHQQSISKAEAAWKEAKAAVLRDPPDDKKVCCKQTEQEAFKEWERRRLRASRLYVVDVGMDYDTLRAAYPDRQRYAIVQGLVKPSYRSYEGKPAWPEGRVAELLVNEIAVPLQWHSEALYKRNTPFEAEVAFGKRLEPWITGLKVVPREHDGQSQESAEQGGE